MLILRLLPVALLALVLFTASADSVAAQPTDGDGDGLTDVFEAGFGPDGVTIISPETNNTASATGRAATGATITVGSFSVTLDPVPDATGLDIEVALMTKSSPTVANVMVAGLSTYPKGFLMPSQGETLACIEDTPGGTVASVVQGSCPPPPTDPNECPPGKIGIELPGLFETVTVSTKTPEPECAPATYTLVNDGLGISIVGLSHTAVALLGGPVGGTTELLVESPDSSLGAEGSAFSVGDYAAAAVAVGIFALIAVGWYARRRWLA